MCPSAESILNELGRTRPVKHQLIKISTFRPSLGFLIVANAVGHRSVHYCQVRPLPPQSQSVMDASLTIRGIQSFFCTPFDCHCFGSRHFQNLPRTINFLHKLPLPSSHSPSPPSSSSTPCPVIVLSMSLEPPLTRVLLFQLACPCRFVCCPAARQLPLPPLGMARLIISPSPQSAFCLGQHPQNVLSEERNGKCPSAVIDLCSGGTRMNE